jgi:hypothetical protein
MEQPKISDKQRSEMILHTYFPEWYPERTYTPFPESNPSIPKEVYDQWIENVKAFIQLS